MSHTTGRLPQHPYGCHEQVRSPARP